MSASPFSSLELAPRDPILGVTEAYVADARPQKVNLGVGVYTDESGRIPLLRAVREAEQRRVESAAPRGYLPIDGIAEYDAAVQSLLLGPASPHLKSGRFLTAQALGGTGALKIGADLLRRTLPSAEVMISDPSWENHKALFEAAGFRVGTYPYYDAATHGVRFDAMHAALTAASAGTVVVLHACCHNPTGADLTEEQWQRICTTVSERALVPVLDIAYQGFGDGIDADAAAVRMFADAGIPFLIASSFSKSFSLYGERVGALTIGAATADEAQRVLSQLKRTIRTNYSNPPTHGGRVVADVLRDADLRTLWEGELAAMRTRIKAMRQALVDGLRDNGVAQDFSFVLRQRGMFSYSGLNAGQVDRLRTEFGIYAVASGRICVAALNAANVGYVSKAMATVIRG